MEHKESLQETEHRNQRRKHLLLHPCFITSAAILILLLLILLTLAVLFLTVLKPKQPKATILSATVNGIAPRVSFPAVDIQLNITLDLRLLIKNNNRFSIKRGSGKSLLLYRNKQVGEADLPPGMMSAMGFTTLNCSLTVSHDEFGSELGGLIRDVMDGRIVLETQTEIPGRIKFLGIFKKHVVSDSKCQITVSLPSMKVKNQECKSNTKF